MTIFLSKSAISIAAIMGIALLGSSSVEAHFWSGNNPWSSDISVRELNELKFGTIAPDTYASGIVEVRANRDNFSRCGQPLICLDAGTRAKFRITGSRSRFIYITLPDEATLANNQGDRMRVSDFKLHTPNFIRGRGRIRKNKPTVLGLGAKLHVASQQAPGHYTGTYEITVSYE